MQLSISTKAFKPKSQKRLSTLVTVALMTTLVLMGCGKKDEAGMQGGAMPAMPVGVITLQATTAPISAETVAQTEGAKEVEIRPRVGGILLKKNV